MEKVYFISDAHLGLGTHEEERQKENRLIAFLDHIKKDATQLFILGDLFDAWFEYRTVIPKGFHRILSKLEECSGKNIALHFLVGNHDCWIRDYFRSEIGMKTYSLPFDIILNGKKIFLHHGDGLANDDLGYRILKKILRNRFSVWFYSWMHPDIGLILARSSSKTSRRYTSNKHYGEGDGMIRYAKKIIENGFDVVIMGHRHLPTYQEIGNGIYINLGDWIHSNTYAELDKDGIKLKQWK
jgi:UDP-2,3-diacylglucosamine hydrolase